MLLYGRNQHNIAKQLSSNLKKIKIKINKLSSHEDMEDTKLCITKSEKPISTGTESQKPNMIPPLRCFGKGKTTETVRRPVFASSVRRREEGIGRAQRILRQ